MRKIVAGEFLTVDGVYQAPGGPDEDVEGGFTNGGWVVPFIDEELGEFIVGMIKSADAFLFGRKTYDIFAGSWPMTPEDDPVGAKFNNSQKYVASNTLTSADWRNTTLLSGDVAAEVAKLKEQDGGEIQLAGSGNLIQTLLKNDLLDELILFFFPVVIGEGKRLFGEGTLPRSLKLVSSRVFGSGVVVSTYQRAGALGTGAYGIETGNYEPFSNK
ncbi:MAG: dihydrofolate reductase family protein [Thermomicrobiales bacterium]